MSTDYRESKFEKDSSLAPLLPTSDIESQNLNDDELYDRFFGWLESKGIVPWPHQEEAVLALLSGNHVILNTPTGSGKSLVALAMHFISLCTHKRSYYTAPLKALVSEKFFDLVRDLGRENVGMITGDTRINVDAPVICCTAEILANQALREGEHAQVACVAMDEFHFYGDPDRGWAWQVPLLTLPQTQFLLMSATLGDVSKIASSLEEKTGKSVDIVADAPRPVPLSYEYVETSLASTVEEVVSKAQTPVYIVHFSQDAALETAQALSNSQISSKEDRERIKEAISGTKFTTGFGKILSRLLRTGVGIHHAGMLPRYRRLVEQLAQQGLLPVICGTDTLGVGINVPIHTVLLTSLTKFDGSKMRRLRAREFHQIAGRAGRMGFDSEGLVMAQAPEYEIENLRALAKAGNDPKKLKKIKRKKPPEGFVTWSQHSFERLVEAQPETLKARLQITHGMVLNEVMQGGNARARVDALIDDSLQTEKEKIDLHARAADIFQTLENSGVIEVRNFSENEYEYDTTVDLPEDFVLDQPLSPFLLAALELLDPDSPTYDMDLISMVEATLEDPRQVLKAQQRQARDQAVQEMKAEGVEYEERMEKLQSVTYPKPLDDLLSEAFERYRQDVPWANDFELKPKSVLRDMLETASDFNAYTSRYGISRSEGTLLRYLSDAYRALSRTVPDNKLDDYLDDVIAWLKLVVRTVDSSLVDEWESVEQAGLSPSSDSSLAPPHSQNEIVQDRRALRLLVRNAMFHRVELVAFDKPQELADLDSQWGYSLHVWEKALDEFYEEHDDINTDEHAHSKEFFILDESREKSEHVWAVRQIFDDVEGDYDWGIAGLVDLESSQDSGQVVFQDYRVGPVEDLRNI